MRTIKFRAWMVTSPNKPNAMRYYTLENIGELEKDARINTGAPIMQYTGLHDKNGKEIYEGDILQDTNTQDKGEVWFNPSVARFLVDWDSKQFNSSTSEVVEIIGNIYENPELLN